ncbi:MAG: hypothetical protein ACRD4L_04560, partial [Pyrinomonadaceae bacterium]
VVPNIQKQSQREKEIEAIYRGEQIVEAIQLYARYRGGKLPTSMDQLVEGIPQGTSKVQILRRSAIKDLLSKSGEWRLIKSNDPEMLEFQRAVVDYAGGVTPPTRDALFSRYALQIISLTNRETHDSTDAESEDVKPEPDNQTPVETEKSDDEKPAEKSDNSQTEGLNPFIGVASSSSRKSILKYYGIEQHNEWIFTPLFR